MAWTLDPSSGELLPSNWAVIRSGVWRRDSGLCQKIRYDTGLPCYEAGEAVDHIVPRSQGGDHGQSNLQVLCHFHHAQKTATESAEGKRKRRDSFTPTRRRDSPLGSLD